MERLLSFGGRQGSIIALGLAASLWVPGTRADAAEADLPQAIRAIMDAPRYARAAWGLRAIALPSGATVTDYGPDSLFFTGSVRKLFSVGRALNALGAGHRFATPVQRLGEVGADGTLEGDLALVASGDLTLGGRTTADGKVAFTNFDHTEANTLGSAILTERTPISAPFLPSGWMVRWRPLAPIRQIRSLRRPPAASLRRRGRHSLPVR